MPLGQTATRVRSSSKVSRLKSTAWANSISDGGHGRSSTSRKKISDAAASIAEGVADTVGADEQDRVVLEFEYGRCQVFGLRGSAATAEEASPPSRVVFRPAPQ